MEERNRLAEPFEANRAHLLAVAFRMLGSQSEAEDAVQEAWLRLNRADASGVENLAGWLTTVVARVCLDVLRSRKSRREEPLEAHDAAAFRADGIDAEQEALLADSVGPALLVVLETLDPAERLAFVLHDMFAVPFEEIARVVGRSPTAARQLASRARRRVQGAHTASDADRARRREIVDAFLAASREGDFAALLSVLDPDVVLRADDVVVRLAAANKWGGESVLTSEIRGAQAVAEAFKGRARGARRTLIDGEAGAAWVVGGEVRSAFVFTFERDRIVGVDLVMEPEHLGDLRVELLDD